MNFISRLFKVAQTPADRKLKRKQLLLGLLSGLLVGLSFPPIPLPYLVFFGLVPYLYVLNQREGLAEINRFTYFTAFIFNLITLYWVGSWTPDADPFLMIAGTVLMFFNPLLFLIPSTLYYVCKQLFNKKVAFMLLPFFWITYEYAYSITEFRFPWLTIAHSLAYFNTFIQISEIIGTFGLSIIIIYVNIFLFQFVKSYFEHKKFNPLYLSVAAIFIVLPLMYGFLRLNSFELSKDSVQVGLIQPDLNPNKKWEIGNLQDHLNLYFDLSEKAINDGAEVIIWPETALPVYLLSGNYKFETEQLHKFVDTNNIFLLTGMPDATFFFEGDTIPKDAKPTKSEGVFYTSYNSIIMFTPESREIQKYGKIKLVPFGEKVPLVEHLPFLGDFLKWNVGISSWNTGKDTTVFGMTRSNISNEIDSIKIAGLVCIESIYPGFTASFVQRGADMIAVVTNDSWYGNSSGPYQHKEFSVFRAVENRRTVIRAANGGISCIIDPLGNTILDTKMFTKTYLVGDVILQDNLTFYTENPLIIPIVSSVLSLWIFGLFLISKLKKRLD